MLIISIVISYRGVQNILFCIQAYFPPNLLIFSLFYYLLTCLFYTNYTFTYHGYIYDSTMGIFMTSILSMNSLKL